MKKFFYSHPDIVLVSIAILLLAVLIGYFSWAINDVVFEIRQAMIVPPPSAAAGFDLAGASQLNYKGLITTSTMPTTSTSANAFSTSTNP